MSPSVQAGDVLWVGLEQPSRTGVGAGRAARCYPRALAPCRPAELGHARYPIAPTVCHRVSCPHSAFDLVNIHLFHDASNLVAWETSPSVYSGIRHKALGYVLDR